MESYLRELDCGPCPYLEDKEWMVEEFRASSFPPGLYEDLLGEGFRRSGMTFYHNRCEGCTRCVPIRLNAATWRPTKTLLRLDRLNADVSVSLCASEFSEERYLLYANYTMTRHDPGKIRGDSRASYISFLISSPLSTTMITDYRLKDGRLVANGYLDVLQNGISSIYFAFDPAFSKRSLGVWSVKRELELGQSLGKSFYYLGFWVAGSPKMDYKARYHPFEYARGGIWLEAADREAAMASMGAA